MIEALRGFAGKAVVLAGAEQAPAVAGAQALGIAYPRTVEEVAELVRWCASEGVPIEPAGGCTWLSRGRPPAHAPLIVSVRELTAVSDYEPADLVISVQAGVTLTALHQATGVHRQRLALDPPAAEKATVGSVVALASSGGQRYAYGTPRDHVLGVQIVTGDGRVLNLGGKVVKNVAGYDVTRLLVGSHGALGIITQANLRLRAVPPGDVTFEMSGAAFELIELANACRSAQFEPAALELIVAPTDEPSTLLVRVQGNAEVIDAATSVLQTVAGARAFQGLNAEEASSRWRTLNDAAIKATFSARLAALPTEAVRLLRLAERVRASFDRATLVLHAGNGIARVHTTDQPPSMAALVEALQHARTELSAVRGSVIVQVAPGELHERFDCYSLPDGELRIMQELKKQFDPASILAPGRFVV